MATENENGIPMGWVWTTLGEVVGFVKGKKPRTLGEKSPRLPIPYIDIYAFEKRIFRQYTDGEGCSFCDKDDVLVVWDGARCGLVGGGVAGAIGSTIARLPFGELTRSYLYHFLISKYDAINKRPRGVGIPHVEPTLFWGLDLPLPPLPEQHRIVAKIEELLTRLDAGVKALNAVKAQLKRYRQSVLKSAFEGKLTAEWREAHKSELEPASVLLERIKEARKKKLGSKYKESPHVDASELPGLPDGWVWTSLPNLGELSRGMSKHRPRDAAFLFGGKYPFIQTGDIRSSNGFITKYAHAYSEAGLKQSKLWPANTLCITIAANIAETSILAIEACFPDSIVGFIADQRVCDTRFVHFYFKTIKQSLESLAPATAQKNINVATLNSVTVPLPPTLEQQQIVSEVDRCFSVTDSIEKSVEQSLTQSDRLRQSILKRAFEGNLVPQDPNDPPASALLERIRMERQTDINSTTKKNGKRTSAGR